MENPSFTDLLNSEKESENLETTTTSTTVAPETTTTTTVPETTTTTTVPETTTTTTVSPTTTTTVAPSTTTSTTVVPETTTTTTTEKKSDDGLLERLEKVEDIVNNKFDKFTDLLESIVNSTTTTTTVDPSTTTSTTVAPETTTTTTVAVQQEEGKAFVSPQNNAAVSQAGDNLYVSGKGYINPDNSSASQEENQPNPEEANKTMDTFIKDADERTLEVAQTFGQDKGNAYRYAVRHLKAGTGDESDLRLVAESLTKLQNFNKDQSVK